MSDSETNRIDTAAAASKAIAMTVWIQCIILAMAIPPAVAVDWEWNGGGNNANWSTAGNWVDGGTQGAPASSLTTAIIMAGSERTTNNQNISTPFELKSLTFKTGAAAFTINGATANHSFEFGAEGEGNFPSINQNSNSLQIINPNIRIAKDLRLKGTGTGQVQMRGVIFPVMGQDRDVYLESTGSYLLSGTNTFRTMNVISGTLVVENNQAAGTGVLHFQGGTSVRSSTANSVPVGGIVLLNSQVLLGNVTFPAFGTPKPLSFMGECVLYGDAGATKTLVVGTGVEILFLNKLGESNAGISLLKAGAGKLTLADDNTYTGNTTIQEGTLVVHGTQGGGNFNVLTGATFKGNGVAALDAGNKIRVRRGAVIKGGDSPGILNISGGVGLEMEGGSTFEFEFDGQTAGMGLGHHSQLRILGSAVVRLELNQSLLDYPTLDIRVIGQTSFPGNGASYKIIDNQGPSSIIGEFQGKPENVPFVDSQGFTWSINYHGGDDGNDVVLTNLGSPFTIPTVTEWGMILLILSFLIIGGLVARQRRLMTADTAGGMTT